MAIRRFRPVIVAFAALAVLSCGSKKDKSKSGSAASAEKKDKRQQADGDNAPPGVGQTGRLASMARIHC